MNALSNSQTSGKQKGGRVRGTPTPIGVKGGCPSPPIIPRTISAVDKIKDGIKKLSKQERKEVRDYLSLLDKNALADKKIDQTATRDEDMWADQLYQCVQNALGSDRVSANRSSAALLLLRKSYCVVERFLHDAKIYSDKSYERNAIYLLLANLLVKYSRSLAGKVGLPVSIKFTVQQIEKIPALFDLAYPGYLESGLASMVIYQFINPPAKEE